MTEKLERQKRLCEFMDPSLDWIMSKRYLYPNPELNIEDAIDLADKLVEKYKDTTWQLIRTIDKGSYVGIIKTSKDILIFSDTPARALTLAVDEFLRRQ